MIFVTLCHDKSFHQRGVYCAMFLLSLWDGNVYRANLQDVLYNDSGIFRAMLNILMQFYVHGEQLYTFVTQREMDPIMQEWGDVFKIEKEV